MKTLVHTLFMFCALSISSLSTAVEIIKNQYTDALSYVYTKEADGFDLKIRTYTTFVEIAVSNFQGVALNCHYNGNRLDIPASTYSRYKDASLEGLENLKCAKPLSYHGELYDAEEVFVNEDDQTFKFDRFNVLYIFGDSEKKNRRRKYDLMSITPHYNRPHEFHNTHCMIGNKLVSLPLNGHLSFELPLNYLKGRSIKCSK